MTVTRSLVDRLRTAGCVFAEDEARFIAAAAPDAVALEEMVARRIAGEPLEYIVGWAEFDGLRIAVDPGVFVPRRRTELLVRRAAALAVPGSSIVDLACGTGAVGLAVATRTGSVALYAVDVDPVSVHCARRNLAAVGGRVYLGDLYGALPVALRGRVDVLVANVPYVPTDAVDLMPREARLHEPLTALDGGRDGLDLVRRVAAGAGDWLAPGGSVLVEIGEDQIAAALDAFARLDPTIAIDDELGATVVVGRTDDGAGWWDVRVLFDTSPGLAPEQVDSLSALLTGPQVRHGVGFLEDRGTGVATGATIVLAASTAADAIAAATELFLRACGTLRIDQTQFREASVSPAWLDPRDPPS